MIGLGVELELMLENAKCGKWEALDHTKTCIKHIDGDALYESL